MGDPIRAEERLAHVVTRLDIALLLDEAGIDARAFSPDELDRLSRMLVRLGRTDHRDQVVDRV